MSLSYRDAGVDLERASEITARLGTRIGAGLFGGFVPIGPVKSYDAPVLVTSIDGVGTKAHLAAMLGHTTGLGRDLVHHCVNDIAVHGAKPLCFLDYLAFNRLDPLLVDALVTSVAEACDALGITLAGGETAEMPLVYPPGHFDMAGAIVGVAEQAEIVDGTTIVAGDVVLGFPSSGLHTNGYSLVQRVFSEHEYHRYEPALGRTLGAALLEPHRCYLTVIRELLGTGYVHGLAHITGGGIVGNTSRIIRDGLSAMVRLPEAPPLFRVLSARGIAAEELKHVFNLGIGLIAVCDPGVLAGPVPAEAQILGEITTTAASRGKVTLQ